MFWNPATPQDPPKLDRKSEHNRFMRSVETWPSPDRELALAIVPHACDPEWEQGYSKVCDRLMGEITRFKAMYAVMQAQKPERRELRVV